MSTPASVALIVGIVDYDDPALPPLPSAAEEAKLIGAALAKTGFTVREPRIGRHSLASVLEYLSTAGPARRVVLYWTGHGAAGPGGHWLFTSDSCSGAPQETSAMSAAHLAAVLTAITGAAQVVAILDSCGSGATASQVARAVHDAPRSQPPAARQPVALSLLSATYDEADAQPLAFAEALDNALRIGPPHGPWPAQDRLIRPQDMARAADAWLVANGAPSAQRAGHTGIEAGTPFFENLRHHERAWDVPRENLTLAQRSGVLEAMANWIAGTDGGLFLLTGSAGTGKTVALWQLAEARGTDSGTGRDIIAVDLAQRGTLRALVEDLAPRLGAPQAATPEELVEALRQAGRSSLIAIDALDEAAAVDRLQIVRRLLMPLSQVPGVHVIVATRGGPGLAGDRETAVIRQAASGFLDLDDDPQADADIARHVTGTLGSTPSSPYRDNPALARRVAAEVARHSRGVFLIASTVAVALAHGERAVEAGDPELVSMLYANVGEAMRQDLTARFGARNQTILDIMAPLAWVEGPGLEPRGAWLRLARALAGDAAVPVMDEDVDWVIANAGFYLAASTADYGLVYRLRHQLFADYLRGQARAASGASDAQVQQAIVAALRPGIGGWPRAGWYERQYLPTHADQAGNVAELFTDSDVMAWADPVALADATAQVPAASRPGLLDLYLSAGPLLQRLDPPLRAFLLDSLAPGSLRKDGSSPGQQLRFSVLAPCRTLWTSASAASRHRLLRASAEDLELLAVLPSEDNRPLIATAGVSPGPLGSPHSDGVQVIDPGSTAPREPLLGLAGDRIAAMLHIPASGGPLLLCLHQNYVLEAWNLTRRTVAWSRDTERPAFYCFLLRSRGEYLAATTGASGPVHVWNPATGDFVCAVQPSGGAIFVVWFNVDGRDRLCVGTNTGNLSFFDADSFAHLGDIRPDEAWERADTAIVDGQPTLAGLRTDGRLELRDARNGRRISVSHAESEVMGETLCVVGGLSGHPVVAASDGGNITLWTTPHLKAAGSLTGHVDEVRALGVLPGRNGLSTLVSAGADGTVRAWASFADPYPSFGRRPTPTSYQSLHKTELDGRAVLLAEELMDVTVVDIDSGARIRSFPRQRMTTRDLDYQRPDIRNVVARGIDAMALTYHDGTAQRMWSLTSGQEYALPTGRFDPRTTELVVAGAHSSALLVIGDGTGPVASFGPDGGLVASFAESGGAVPRLALSGERNPVVVLQRDARLAVYDARRGTRMAEAPVPEPRIRLLDGTEMEDGTWIVCAAYARATWLLRIGTGTDRPHGGDNSPSRILERPAASAAMLTCAGQHYLAVADKDQVLIIRLADGSVTLRIPFTGRVRDLVATGSSRLCVVYGESLAHLEVTSPETTG